MNIISIIKTLRKINNEQEIKYVVSIDEDNEHEE